MAKPILTKHLILTASIMAISACQSQMSIRPVSDLPPGVAGVWQSDGYGYVLDATGEFPRLFHHTPEFCIEDEETSAALSNYLVPENLKFSADGEKLFFAPTFEEYPITMDGIKARPPACGMAVSGDPETTFESFASYMASHYAFFDLYDVDWDASIAAARPRVSNDMSEADLYQVFEELLAPIGDGHLTLEAELDGDEAIIKPGLSTVGHALKRIAARDGTSEQKLNNQMMSEYWMSGIRKGILGGNGKMVANDFIQYGIVSEDIGYIAFATEAGYAGKGLLAEEDDLAVLRQTLDAAITKFNEASVKAVIIDLSVNFGGYDFVSREIAERFATQPSLAYSKYAADSTIRTPFEIRITPHDGIRYTGSVVLVTTNVTVSAGEMLTMALRSQPNVVHVGETTRGAHSDVLTKKLPNGWTLNLSNEVYHDHEGNFLEKSGIAPHQPIQIFDPENPFTGHVEAISQIVDDINTRVE